MRFDLTTSGNANAAARRPPELEDWLNRYVYHPASWRLARLIAPTPITPNMVSLFGAVMVMLAAYLYSFTGVLLAMLAAFAVHLAWHVVDGADGDLARLTGRSGPQGELVDGLCDITGHVVLYLVLGTIAAEKIGPVWAWVLACSAGASRLVQAAHYESLRRGYQQIVYGTPWLGSTPHPNAGAAARNFLIRLYLAAGRLVAPQARALGAAGVSVAAADQMKQRLRSKARALLKPMTPLSANYRTLATGIAMLAGHPHWLFVFEAIVLNVVLIVSIGNSHRVIGQIVADQAAQVAASTRR